MVPEAGEVAVCCCRGEEVVAAEREGDEEGERERREG